MPKVNLHNVLNELDDKCTLSAPASEACLKISDLNEWALRLCSMMLGWRMCPNRRVGGRTPHLKWLPGEFHDPMGRSKTY